MGVLDGAMYRGRLAPSPTGLLHLGHARTFWTAYRRALASGGTLVMRVEDLDPQRSKAEYAAAMLEDLRWLGIEWQEGPGAASGKRAGELATGGLASGVFADLGEDGAGAYGPYRQSRRYAWYRAIWERLRASGAIYPCHCSRRELARSAQAPHEDAADEPVYPGTCRTKPGTEAEAAATAGVNWRFRVPEGEQIAFVDGRQGPRSYTAGREFGDFLVWRRDDVPAYQLAVVVDDAAMRITEVVRGADLLLSTARQILLYRALGLATPAWYHCDLLRDAEGERLAKRTDALSLRALRESGVRAEALVAGFAESSGADAL